MKVSRNLEKKWKKFNFFVKFDFKLNQLTLKIKKLDNNNMVIQNKCEKGDTSAVDMLEEVKINKNHLKL